MYILFLVTPPSITYIYPLSLHDALPISQKGRLPGLKCYAVGNKSSRKSMPLPVVGCSRQLLLNKTLKKGQIFPGGLAALRPDVRPQQTIFGKQQHPLFLGIQGNLAQTVDQDLPKHHLSPQIKVRKTPVQGRSALTKSHCPHQEHGT